MAGGWITGFACYDGTGPQPEPALGPTRPGHVGRERGASQDLLCRLGLGAAASALLHARIAAPPEGDGDGDGARWRARAGVIVGTAHGCHAANETFYRGFLAHGMLGASPRVFSYTLPSSPAGEISIRYGITGPCEALVSGRHAGVQALGRAAMWCAQEQGGLDLVLVVAVEVGGGTVQGLGLAAENQAVALVIEREAPAQRRGARHWATVEGQAGAFRRRAPTVALQAALGKVAKRAGELVLRADAGSPGSDGGCASMMALVRWLAAGGAAGERIWLAEADPDGGAAVVGVRRA